MENIVPENNGLTALDTLATEAKAYSESMAMNMLQLGRVYTDAKKLVPHGKWGEWIRENGGMNERSAQQLMQIYTRFGSNPAFNGIDKSKLIKMLSLPAGSEEAFMAGNAVDEMSSRAVEEAVKHEREKAQAALEKEKAAREQAEARAEELANRPPTVPDNIAETLNAKEAELQKYRNEIDRLTTLSQGLMDENRSISKIEKELQEAETLLAEKQAEYNALQDQLLNTQSAIAKGEAEPAACNELTIETFAAAVQQFMVTCSRMPHMGKTFAALNLSVNEISAYQEYLQIMEQWLHGAQDALHTINAEVIEP